MSVRLRLSVFLWVCCFSYAALNSNTVCSRACSSPPAGVINAADWRIFLCRTQTLRDGEVLQIFLVCVLKMLVISNEARVLC